MAELKGMIVILYYLLGISTILFIIPIGQAIANLVVTCFEAITNKIIIKNTTVTNETTEAIGFVVPDEEVEIYEED